MLLTVDSLHDLFQSWGIRIFSLSMKSYKEFHSAVDEVTKLINQSPFRHEFIEPQTGNKKIHTQSHEIVSIQS